MEDGASSRSLLPALAALPGHLVWRSAAKVNCALGQVLSPDVDIHAYAALLALGHSRARSQQWLADSISVSRTTMTRVAAGLVDQGLVERVRNPSDRRSYALTRTVKGAAAARRWRRHVEELEDTITAGFAPSERRQLQALLLHVAEEGLTPDTPQALRESIGFLVTRVHARMHAQLMDSLLPLGIEPRHYGSMAALAATGPVVQAELARQLGVSAPSIVEITDHLESRGLVERRRRETDRRTQVLHLLPAARPVLARAKTAAERTVDDVLAPLDAGRRQRLVALLKRFVTGA